MTRSGVTVVVAAGNENDDACGCSPVFVSKSITEGAADKRDVRSGFSNYGSCVQIFAPGTDITSAAHNSRSGLVTFSGTSMACPHVAGAAARLLGKNPSLKPSEVMEELRGAADKNKIRDARGSPNIMMIHRPVLPCPS